MTISFNRGSVLARGRRPFPLDRDVGRVLPPFAMIPRTRLYEKYPGGPIMRSVFVKGKEARKSLGHCDKEKAIRQGYALVNALLANEHALDEQSLTLGLLMDLYLESPAHLSKKARTQHDEGRMLRRVVGFFGRTRNVDTLSESDVKRYTMARRRGEIAPPGVGKGRPVGVPR